MTFPLHIYKERGELFVIVTTKFTLPAMQLTKVNDRLCQLGSVQEL